MSKLSDSLKALINASHVRPHTTPAPKHISSVYERIAGEAATKKVGLPAWLCASSAVTFTMNSPDSLLQLYQIATGPKHNANAVYAAELMRETGLKCIGFNGVPRTINSLGAFHAGLPTSVQDELKKRKPRRHLTPSTIGDTVSRGNALWNSLYYPLADKLTAKLAQSHPDLPVFIIEGEYGCLFSDPPSQESDPNRPEIGRVLTSIAAVACLRSQTGVGPQVVSHVFGLRKAYEDGTAEDDIEGGKWLATNEGSCWLLERIDEIVNAIGGDRGSTFAAGFEKAKL